MWTGAFIGALLGLITGVVINVNHWDRLEMGMIVGELVIAGSTGALIGMAVGYHLS